MTKNQQRQYSVFQKHYHLYDDSDKNKFADDFLATYKTYVWTRGLNPEDQIVLSGIIKWIAPPIGILHDVQVDRFHRSQSQIEKHIAKQLQDYTEQAKTADEYQQRHDFYQDLAKQFDSDPVVADIFKSEVQRIESKFAFAWRDNISRDEYQQDLAQIFSAQSEAALESARLINSVKTELNQKLDNMQVRDEAQRKYYFEELGKLVSEKSGLVRADLKQLDQQQKKAREVLEDLMNGQKGLRDAISQTQAAVSNISHDVKVIKKYVDQQQENAARSARIQAFHASFDFMQALGVMTNSRGLQRGAVIGRSVYQITTSMTHVIAAAKVGKALTMASMGDIASIGMAAMSIIQLFGKKQKSESQIILEQLGQLSEQIADFRNEVMQQFEQVYRNQYLLFETITQGFDLIYTTIKDDVSDLKLAAITRLDEISLKIDTLINMGLIGQHGHKISELEDAIHLIESRYSKLEELRLGLVDSSGLAKGKIFDTADVLRRWMFDSSTTLAKSKHSTITGEQWLDGSLNYEVLKSVAPYLSKTGQTFGFLVGYVGRHLLTKNSEIKLTVINIDIFLQTFDAFLKLHEIARLTNNEQIIERDDVERARQGLSDILDTIAQLQNQASSIFFALFTQTRENLTALRLQVSQEGSRLLDQNLAAIRIEQRKNFIASQMADIKGVQLQLNHPEFSQSIDLPAELVLSHQLGIGKLVFDASRSSRSHGQNSHVWHEHGQWHARCWWPSATFVIDVYFDFNGTRTAVMTAEKAIASEVTNVQFNAAHHANQIAAGWNSDRTARAAMTDDLFYTQQWSNVNQLTFGPSTVDSYESIHNTDAVADVRSVLIDHYTREAALSLSNNDSYRGLVHKLDMQKILIEHYIELMGFSREKVAGKLLALHDRENLSEFFENTSVISQDVTDYRDNYLESTFAQLEHALQQCESELDSLIDTRTKTPSTFYSPTALPVLERQVKLGNFLHKTDVQLSIFSSAATFLDAQKFEEKPPYQSDDNCDTSSPKLGALSMMFEFSKNIMQSMLGKGTHVSHNLQLTTQYNNNPVVSTFRSEQETTETPDLAQSSGYSLSSEQVAHGFAQLPGTLLLTQFLIGLFKRSVNAENVVEEYYVGDAKKQALEKIKSHKKAIKAKVAHILDELPDDAVNDFLSDVSLPLAECDRDFNELCKLKQIPCAELEALSRDLGIIEESSLSYRPTPPNPSQLPELILKGSKEQSGTNDYITIADNDLLDTRPSPVISQNLLKGGSK